MSNNVYFAAQEPEKVASALLGKAFAWKNGITSNGYLDKIVRSWTLYHGASRVDDLGRSHKITFSGEEGELTNLSVNHFRNIGQHIINMTCSNRPAMEARAVNTDYKSLVQTTLANGILDYFMREKRLEKYLKTAVEYAVVLGAGYIKMEWNSSKGEIYDYNEDTQTPVYEGDIEFSNLSPFDIIEDTTKEGQDKDWICIRSYKNRFDLIAKFPELETRILALPTKSDRERFRLGVTNFGEETDDIEIYEFYHKRTECMPNGRYLLFLADDIVCTDVPMPYRVLPVFRISAGEILGTPLAYTPLWDLMPIQEAVDSLYSTILTNQNAFGVQNVLLPRGTDISASELAGGLRVIEFNAQAGTPAPLNLTQTPAEVFKFLDMLVHAQETISGVNSVARGDPQSSLKSGTSLALVQSMALQFMSGLQQSYVQLIEDVGNGIIKILQDFAHAPRLVAIVGKSNRAEMKEFSADDISNISRVIVDVGNPLARTTAGRVQMADQMLQYQMLSDPQQYMNIINTGKLEIGTEDVQHELLLIKAENEKIVEGEVPPVTVIDQHQRHIKGHRSVLADPDLRKDKELVARATAHIQMHIDQLRQADPQLLQLIGEQPLPPPQPPQQQGAPQQQEGPTATDVNQNQNPELLQAPMQGQQGMQQQGGQIQGPMIEQGVNLPNMPKVDGGLLPNADLQAQAMGNVR